MDELKSLLAKRGIVKGQVTRFKKFFDKITPKDISELEFRLKRFETLIDKYIDIQSQIVVLREDDPQEMTEQEEFETQYYQLGSDARSYISNNQVTSPGGVMQSIRSTVSEISHSEETRYVKLPTINLPTFCGSYDEWLDFYETFSSLIDNDDRMPQILKFRYLKSCLKDDAASLIQQLEVSADNYQIAWELLKERYENKPYIAKNHITALFNINTMVKESHVQLRQTVDSISKHVRALKALNYDNWEIVLVVLIVSKLDPATKRSWEQSQDETKTPTIVDLLSFLNKQAKLLETLHLSKQENVNNTSNKANKTRKPEFKTNVHVAINKQACHHCKGQHYLYNCREFLKLTPQQRISQVKKLNLCLNCLKGNHFVTDCKSLVCRQCNQKHNTLLHLNQSNTKVERSQPENKSVEQVEVKTLTTHLVNQNSTEVLLATALVKVFDKQNKPHNCCVLLDNGSQLNFVSEACCKKLQLSQKTISATISGINHMSVTNVCLQADLTFYSQRESYKAKITCIVLPEITQNLPSVSFNANFLEIPQNISLANPNFNKASTIDILLGATIFFELLSIGQISLGKNKPVLQKTQLGWIISGPITLPNSMQKTSLVHCAINDSFNNQMSKFWELEEINVTNNMSPEEQLCENHFQTNTTRTVNGQFVVKIPLRDNVTDLGESRSTALKRFFSMKRKLNANIHLKKQYINFMNEYKNLNHMTKLNSDNINSNLHYYLPHHPVVRESSLTTKLRVVFDGSAQTNSNLSLNQVQYVGPTIQQDLFSIILRFRKHNIAITADISKMYRQVLVHESQRDLQRIFWREQTDHPVEIYQLNTVTYGTASAPYLAIRCLYQLALDNKICNPVESNIIQKDFYVDDLLSGSDTLDEALKIQSNISKILKAGNFDLRKWASNNKQFLEKINSGIEADDNLVYVCENPELKTLGIVWNSSEDTIQYSVKQFTKHEKVTKRSISSTIAQIYDPLGLIAPITIIAKQIMQQLWQCGLSWDESVPNVIFTKWIKFISQLDSINHIHAPRHVLCKNPKQIELHGFCDSSESAYGACIFIKSVDANSDIHTNLLCAKSRVAPLRNTTLPRLELCGALLLAQLANKIINTIELKFDEIYYWCDSTIVLSWINSPSNKWQTFVANRVSQIQNLFDVKQWRHVRSEQNSADLLTRGLDAKQLVNCKLWWKGPTWLYNNDENCFLNNEFVISNEISIPEMRKNQVVLLATKRLDIITKYSSLSTLIHVMAYLLRYMHNLRAKSLQVERKSNSLSVDELNNAKKSLVKLAQREHFSQELNLLKDEKRILKGKLVKLSPFLDDESLIRVGGRLQNSEFSYNKQHPLVIPGKHALTTLILKHEHEELKHCGPQILLATVREQYWPVSGRNAARKIVRNCVQNLILKLWVICRKLELVQLHHSLIVG